MHMLMILYDEPFDLFLFLFLLQMIPINTNSVAVLSLYRAGCGRTPDMSS